MELVTIFVILSLEFRLIFGDFYSGTLSWEPVALPPDTQVRFHGRYGFKYNTGPGCGSFPPGSFATQLTHGNQIACTQGCSPPQNITGGDLNYYCASYITSEWEQGDEFLIDQMPSQNNFIVSYSGGHWIPTDFGASITLIHFQTSINLQVRSDTNRPNSSPVTSSFPVYEVPFDCITSIQIPTYDPDGDQVSCRWANTTECGGSCAGLPSSKLDMQRCILTLQPKRITGFRENGIYVIQLTAEDFPQTSITVGSNTVQPTSPLSQVPLQFIIKTVKISSPCTTIPKITDPSPKNGQVFIVPQAQSFSQMIYATFTSPASRIQDFIISVPYGTRKSTLRNVGGNVWSTELTWTPSQDQYSTNILCFQAQDNNGLLSEQFCYTILAGVDDPCAVNPCLHGGSCGIHLDTYACQCTPEYEGRNCSIDKNDCLSNPCKNGGTCWDQVGDFQCFCPVGFMGKDCQQIDYCASSPCQNFATCTSSNSGFHCTCTPGFSGQRCQTELDECLSSPCENSGTCVDMVGDFFCQCPIEYTGKNCSMPKDFCNPSPCLNGGVCYNYDDSYRCSCPSGYIGLDCETYQPESCSADDDNHCMCLLNGRRVKLPFPQHEQTGFTKDDLAAGAVGLPIGIASGVLLCLLFHKLIRPRCCKSNSSRAPRQRPPSTSSTKSLISRDSTASPSDIQPSVKSVSTISTPSYTNMYRPNRVADWQ